MSPILSKAQTDSLAKAKAAMRKAGNTTKLEILYESVTHTSRSSSGYYRTYTVDHPMISIDGKAAVEIDKRGDILRRYYAKCYLAQAELNKSNTYRKNAKLYMWGGFAAGTAIAFSGLFNNPGMDEGRFFSRFGIGAGVMVTGTVVAWIKYRKATKHLHMSVDVYNDKCYFPLKTDTTQQPKDTTAARKPGETSPVKMVPKKKVLYDLLRNEPENSGMSGFALTLANVDVNGLNTNIKGGVGFFYTHKNNIGLSVDYQVAYLDNPEVEKNVTPFDWQETAAPTRYRRANNLDIQTKFPVKSWTVERKYGVGLGSKRLGGRVAEVVGSLTGDVQKSVTLRLGYQIDNRLIYGSSTGIEFKTNTEPYIYHYGGEEYPLIPGNVNEQSAMMRSGIISAGIGLSSYWDMKIQLLDNEFSGVREVKRQNDLYLDAMYAQQLKLEDLVYYHSLLYVTDEGEHIPQRINISATPLTKIGARAGYRSTRMKSHRGHRVGAEIGIRPGPKVVIDNVYFQLQAALIFGGRINH
ncbi:hypothetical protein EG028_21655 [Chitinophaga barathri]|uniref:Uncharacterized protein n=1 Tax=Chitinophaga barathri TaxID=1647451 RepID=A0A3N4MGJ9_9BACT|nr:hypothetical protein EG028_21655 [Chitinophaga barathri]